MSVIDELRRHASETLKAFKAFREKTGIYNVKMLAEIQGPRLERLPAMAELFFGVDNTPELQIRVMGPFHKERIFSAWLNSAGEAVLGIVPAYQSDIIEVLEMVRYWLADMIPKEEGED
jgi:hypothetical protein